MSMIRTLIIASLLFSCSTKTASAWDKEIYSKQITTDRDFINWDSAEIEANLRTNEKTTTGQRTFIVLDIKVLETALAQDFGKETIFTDSRIIDNFTVADSGEVFLNTSGGYKILCGLVKGKKFDKLKMDSRKCRIDTKIEWVNKKIDLDFKMIPVLKIFVAIDS